MAEKGCFGYARQPQKCGERQRTVCCKGLYDFDPPLVCVRLKYRYYPGRPIVGKILAGEHPCERGLERLRLWQRTVAAGLMWGLSPHVRVKGPRFLKRAIGRLSFQFAAHSITSLYDVMASSFSQDGTLYHFQDLYWDSLWLSGIDAAFCKGVCVDWGL